MKELLSEYGRTILTGICVAISINILLWIVASIGVIESNALQGAIGTGL
jgi:hypothetical protein